MQNNINDVVDLKDIYFKIKKNWFLFAICILITLLIAFAYNRYSTNYYLVETSILIKSDDDISSASDLIYEKVNSSNKILENKEQILTSFPLIFKTLSDLRFDISYFIKGNIKTSESYFAPIILHCDDTQSLIGKKIEIDILDKNNFLFKDLEAGDNKNISFKERFLFYGKEIYFEFNPLYELHEINKIPDVIVKFLSIKNLARKYKNDIAVSKKDKKSTVLDISLLSEDQMKGVVFLNKLTENYIKDELNEKNIASKGTVDFINNQLIKMSDSLMLIEQQIEEYKNTNQITDLNFSAQSIYANIIALETELADVKKIDSYYKYLSEYLIKEEGLEGVSVPTSFGINDDGLAFLISRLIETQTKKNILVDGGQINNPAIAQYNRQIKQLIINLQEAIKTSQSTNKLIIDDIKNRIKKKEIELRSIPEKTREIGSIERLQLISENIYTFLLKKRAEAKIVTSSNVSDTKVIEPAIFINKKPSFPNKSKTYTIALFIGLFFPLIFLVIKDAIYDKIITRSDLKNATNIPLIALIRRNFSGFNLLSSHNPKSSIYEGFRALRSNLNFLSSDKKNNVFLITSSISGEGKTYIAANLAIVYASSGKKTIVVGADLRRPKLFKYFNVKNDKGISNHILNGEKLNDVIIKSDFDNLDLLLSGTTTSKSFRFDY